MRGVLARNAIGKFRGRFDARNVGPGLPMQSPNIVDALLCQRCSAYYPAAKRIRIQSHILHAHKPVYPASCTKSAVLPLMCPRITALHNHARSMRRYSQLHQEIFAYSR